ncbi:hypothetical protein ALC62_00115 [Cyphomyrmex costatus]|uniref:Uncharacterized protein n=1 Tax=Cyphomyrmex costatus TaxID=456900 RepID=A0A151K1Y4_9HYME|nr:hypothetical protein ALC62_08997 [Cyphomyrmex costatus]KYN50087.1 hypothetical protein ALC62_00115 [Cyphomyrmex costatus]
MTVPTFVDQQEFIVRKKIIAVEVAVLRKGLILSYYIFTYSMSRNFLTKFKKYCTSWLSAYYHGLQWKNGMITYSITERVITMVIE